MAAGMFQRPGTKYGPCKGRCTHTDCAEGRKAASVRCRICTKPIGYDTPFYDESRVTKLTPMSERVLVHAACLHREFEKEQEAEKQAA